MPSYTFTAPAGSLYSDRVKIERQQNPMCGLGFLGGHHGSPRPEYPSPSSKSAAAHQPSSLLASTGLNHPKSEMMFSLYGYQPDLKYVSLAVSDQLTERSSGGIKDEKMSPSHKNVPGSDGRKYTNNHFGATNGNGGLGMSDAMMHKTEPCQRTESIKTKSVIVEPLGGGGGGSTKTPSGGTNLRESYRHGGSITLGTAGQRTADVGDGLRPSTPSSSLSQSSSSLGSTKDTRPRRPLSIGPVHLVAANGSSLVPGASDVANTWPTVSEPSICGIGQQHQESLIYGVENRHSRPQPEQRNSSSSHPSLLQAHSGFDRPVVMSDGIAIHVQDSKPVGLQAQSVTISSLIQQGLVPNPLYTPAANVVQANANPSRVSVPHSLTFSSVQSSVGLTFDGHQSSADSNKESSAIIIGSKRRTKRDHAIVLNGRKKVKMESPGVYNTVTLGSVRKSESVSVCSARLASSLFDGPMRLLVLGENPVSTAPSTVGSGNSIRALPGYNDSFKSFVDNTVQNAFFNEGKPKSSVSGVFEVVDDVCSPDVMKRTDDTALRQIVGSTASYFAATQSSANLSGVFTNSQSSVGSFGGSCQAVGESSQDSVSNHGLVATTNVCPDVDSDTLSAPSPAVTRSPTPPLVSQAPVSALNVDAPAFTTTDVSQVLSCATLTAMTRPISCQTPPQLSAVLGSLPHSQTSPLSVQSSSLHYTKKAWLQRYSDEDKTKTTVKTVETASSSIIEPVVQSSITNKSSENTEMSCREIKDFACEEQPKIEEGCTVALSVGEDVARERKCSGTPNKHQAMIKNETVSTSESNETRVSSPCSLILCSIDKNSHTNEIIITGFKNH